MSKKITWKKVYDKFKLKFPNLRKEVLHWSPHDYETIKLYFIDGRMATYEYTANRFTWMERLY